MSSAHTIASARCASCQGAIELDCEGLTGFWGYKTYNEYSCPHCGKQNHALSTGAVVAARVPAGRGAAMERTRTSLS